MSDWTDQQRSAWATHQRYLRRCGLLSLEKIQKLDSVGWFNWGAEEKRATSNSAIKKTRLLEMGRNGEPRPSQGTPLGRALVNYICKSVGNKNYDPDFDREIREAAPHWWPADVNKATLLEMARNRESRPSKKSKDLVVAALGTALCNYTRSGGKSYDPDFDHEIKRLASQWFEDTAAINKAKLLEMAGNGEPKPKWGTPLYKVLCHYIDRNGKNYDADFDEEIRCLVPQWFKSSNPGEVHDE